MFRLIKQMFVVLLCFRKPFVTKFVSLNNEACMIRPTLIDLDPDEIKYYRFMISLDKYSGISNSIDAFATKICIPSKTK